MTTLENTTKKMDSLRKESQLCFTTTMEKTRARDPMQRLHLTPRYENALTPLNEIKLTPTEKTLQGIFFIVLDSVLAGGV